MNQDEAINQSALPLRSLKMTRRRLCRKIIIDLFTVGVLAVPIVVCYLAVKPYHRGFFCDDESLMHPFKDDTVPSWLLGVVGIGLPMFCIITIEGLLGRMNHNVILPRDAVTKETRPYTERCYRIAIVFVFGMTVTQLLTELGKFSIGRLRPHFFAVCKPDQNKCSSATGYVLEDICTGIDKDKIHKARLSFPSGHASIAMFCMLYLMVYLQVRVKVRRFKFAKAGVQVIIFCLAAFTCLSRISDYKHHWSDVISGAMIGVTVCMLVVSYLSDLVLKMNLKTILQTSSDQIPMYRQLNSSESVTSEGVAMIADDMNDVIVNIK